MKNKLLLTVSFLIIGMTSALSQLTQTFLVESRCAQSGEAMYLFSPVSPTGFFFLTAGPVGYTLPTTRNSEAFFVI